VHHPVTLPKTIRASAGTADNGTGAGCALDSFAVTDRCSYGRTENRTGHRASTHSLANGNLLAILLTFRQIDLVLRDVHIMHINNGRPGEGLVRTPEKCDHAYEKKSSKHQILLRYINVQRTS